MGQKHEETCRMQALGEAGVDQETWNHMVTWEIRRSGAVGLGAWTDTGDIRRVGWHL